GFKIFYDRTLYALHNHKFKTDMLQWFIDRTTEIGNYTLISYALNSRFNEFLGIESILPRLQDIYSIYKTEELKKLSKVFDETVENVILSLRNLEKFDHENGYLKDVR